MKPVAIFRHLPIEGPGYFATFLDNNHIPWRLIKIDAGETPPTQIDKFSGLVFMGGPMSVNDEAALPWLVEEKKLVREAIASGKTVLGVPLDKLFQGISVGSHMEDFGQGVVNLIDVVYFVLIIAFFLTITSKILEARRWRV